DKEAGQAGEGAGEERGDGDPTEAAAVAVFAGSGVERGDGELAFSPDEVIGDHDAADRAEQRAVTDEPGEDVAGGIGDEFPRHDQDADETGDESADAEGDFFGGEVGEVIGGADDVGGDVGREGGETE